MFTTYRFTSIHSLFLILILLISLVSCQTNAPSNEVSDITPTSTSTNAAIDVQAEVVSVTSTATQTATRAPTSTPLPPPATTTPLPTSTSRPTDTPEPTATSTEEATREATELPPTVTPASTDVPENTAVPTLEPSPPSATETIPETPAATATSAPVAAPSGGTVSQPPYEASACSDKYPCSDDPAAWESRVQVPAGYSATYFAHIVGQQPTGLAYGPDGLLYVATQGGTIYTIDGNGNANPYVSGLIAPTGIAFRPGTSQLFVSSRVMEANYDGEAQVSVIEGGGIRQIIGGFSCCYAFMHGPHGIDFGPDGMGYVGVGARDDHGELLGSENQEQNILPLEAGIIRFNPDSGATEKFASGLRNPFGIAFDANGQLYATDNGPDHGPPDELHRVVPGANHGYPYYDCEYCLSAPEGINPLPPTYNFPAHSSPTGMTVYKGSQFPGAYNNLFVTLWSAFPGAQKIMRFGAGGVGASNFATGFAAPIDVTTDPAGNLYVADWATGIIFKISYTG